MNGSESLKGYKKNDEPAFPFENPPYHAGMSLRDYFAGQALTGLTKLPSCIGKGACQYIALVAFNIADAMLKERENKTV